MGTKATKDICSEKNFFCSSYELTKNGKHFFFGNSLISPIIGKKEVLLKLILERSSNSIMCTMLLKLEKFNLWFTKQGGLEASFEYDNIVLTRNDEFVGKRC